MLDHLEVFSITISFIPFVFYVGIVINQFQNIDKETYRLIVLSTRAAACLPAYAFCVLISFMEPYYYALMEGPITFIEGYSFICFFTLIVVNCGGPKKLIQLMEETDEPLVCTKYLCKRCKLCPDTKKEFYRNCNRYLFHFCWTRTIVTVLGTMCYYSKTKIGYLTYIACSCLAAAILLYAPFYLFNLYDNIYRSCTNIHGVGKVVAMKLSVSLITYLGIMELFLVKFDGGYRLVGDEQGYGDLSDATHRAVCVLLLVLFSALAAMSFPSFSRKMTPRLHRHDDVSNTHNNNDNDNDNDSHQDNNNIVKDNLNGINGMPVTWCRFLWELFRLLDIVYSLELDDDEEGGDDSAANGDKKLKQWEVGGDVEQGVRVRVLQPGREETEKIVCGVDHIEVEGPLIESGSNGDKNHGDEKERDHREGPVEVLQDPHDPFISQL